MNKIERNNQIITDYKSGMTEYAIAKKHGMSQSMISMVLKADRDDVKERYSIFDKKYFRKGDEFCEHLTTSSGVSFLRFTEYTKEIKGYKESYYNKNISTNFYKEWEEIPHRMFLSMKNMTKAVM